MVMASAETLNSVCRKDARLRVATRHCVAPLAHPTSIAASWPIRTSVTKSVKYDIDNVALPRASGRWTFEIEMTMEPTSRARKSQGSGRLIRGIRSVTTTSPTRMTRPT